MKKIIDLEEAIKHLESNVVMMTDYDDGIRGCDIRELLEELPLIEPEPKKGHWEIYIISPFDGEDCRCSECGKIECAPYWNYCPNCGARMSG